MIDDDDDDGDDGDDNNARIGPQWLNKLRRLWRNVPLCPFRPRVYRSGTQKTPVILPKVHVAGYT